MAGRVSKPAKEKRLTSFGANLLLMLHSSDVVLAFLGFLGGPISLSLVLEPATFLEVQCFFSYITFQKHIWELIYIGGLQFPACIYNYTKLLLIDCWMYMSFQLLI